MSPPHIHACVHCTNINLSSTHPHWVPPIPPPRTSTHVHPCICACVRWAPPISKILTQTPDHPPKIIKHNVQRNCNDRFWAILNYPLWRGCQRWSSEIRISYYNHSTSIPIILPPFLLFYLHSYYSTSIPIIIPPFLLFYLHSYYYTSIPIILPPFLLFYLHSYYYTSIPIILPPFLLFYLHSYYSTSIPIILPPFLLFYLHSYYSCIAT